VKAKNQVVFWYQIDHQLSIEQVAAKDFEKFLHVSLKAPEIADNILDRVILSTPVYQRGFDDFRSNSGAVLAKLGEKGEVHSEPVEWTLSLPMSLDSLPKFTIKSFSDDFSLIIAALKSML